MNSPRRQISLPGALARKRLAALSLVLVAVLGLAGCRPGVPAPGATDLVETPYFAANLAALQAAGIAPELVRSVPAYAGNLTYDDTTHEVSGELTLRNRNRSDDPLQRIYFHLYENAFKQGAAVPPYEPRNFSQVYPEGFSEGSITVSEVTADGQPTRFAVDETILTVDLPRPVKPGSAYTVAIHFAAVIPGVRHRTGRLDDRVWLGNLLPILAVYDSEGWHLDPYYAVGDPFYSETANYQITWDLPEGYRFAGTGTHLTRPSGNRVQVVSEALMVRDYAAAFGDCYEQNSTTASDGTVVNALLYPGTDADQVLARAEECLEYYVSHIGPYPYPAFTVVEGRIPPGGMEYPTLIMISDQRFSDGRWPVTIAHETAHQWFYNLVGNDQVRSAWLDEGLAEYMTIALISESSVSQKAELLQNDLNSARDAVNNRPDETPSLPLSAFSVWGDYYDNAYAKPALMLEELSRGIGPEGFDELIRSYYNQCRFKIAHPADFINLASQTAGRDLSNWFDQWLSTSAMPGYPAQ